MHIQVHLTEADGRQRTLSLPTGRSLMKAAVAAGVEAIAADCGGTLTCATCHVFIDPPWQARLAPPSADESAMLDMTAVPREPTSRLSCQVSLTPELDGLQLRLPARQY